MQDVPYGYCRCGCGNKTGIATLDRPERGHVKGEPFAFVHGHNTRRARVDPTPKACSRCGEVKSPEAFYSDARKYDGLDTACKDCVKMAVRGWVRENPERAAETQRLWREGNPERCREYQRVRQERERAAFVEVVDRLVVLEMDDGVCGICGGDVDPLRYHIDHIVPLSRGGEDSYANVQLAHPECNRRKSIRVPEEMAA